MCLSLRGSFIYCRYLHQGIALDFLSALVMFKGNQFTCSPHEQYESYISQDISWTRCTTDNAKSGVSRPMNGDGGSICIDRVLELPGVSDQPDRKACLTTRAGAQTTYSTTRLPALCHLMWAMPLGLLKPFVSARIEHGSKASTLCNTNYLTLLSIERCFRWGKRVSLRSSHSFC